MLRVCALSAHPGFQQYGSLAWWYWRATGRGTSAIFKGSLGPCGTLALALGPGIFSWAQGAWGPSLGAQVFTGNVFPGPKGPEAPAPGHQRSPGTHGFVLSPRGQAPGRRTWFFSWVQGARRLVPGPMQAPRSQVPWAFSLTLSRVPTRTIPGPCALTPTPGLGPAPFPRPPRPVPWVTKIKKISTWPSEHSFGP